MAIDEVEITRDLRNADIKQAARTTDDLAGAADYFSQLASSGISDIVTNRGNLSLQRIRDENTGDPIEINIEHRVGDPRRDEDASTRGSPKYLHGIRYRFLRRDGELTLVKEKLLSSGIGQELEVIPSTIDDATTEALGVLGYVHAQVLRSWGEESGDDTPHFEKASDAFTELLPV